MRLTMVQVLINSKGLNMNPIQSLYYVSPACFIGLFVPFRESPAGSSWLPFRPWRGRLSCSTATCPLLPLNLTSNAHPCPRPPQ
jgi:hypothetical protein